MTIYKRLRTKKCVIKYQTTYPSTEKAICFGHWANIIFRKLLQLHQVTMELHTSVFNGNHARLPWQLHQVAIKNTPGYNRYSTTVLFQPHQFIMTTTPGFHVDHTRLPWQPYLVTIKTTPCYHDNQTWIPWVHDKYDNHTKRPGQPHSTRST